MKPTDRRETTDARHFYFSVPLPPVSLLSVTSQLLFFFFPSILCLLLLPSPPPPCTALLVGAGTEPTTSQVLLRAQVLLAVAVVADMAIIPVATALSPRRPHAETAALLLRLFITFSLSVDLFIPPILWLSLSPPILSSLPLHCLSIASSLSHLSLSVPSEYI